MGPQDSWLVADVFRALGGRGEVHGPEVPVSAAEELRAASRVLMSDIGEASIRAVATSALNAYARLGEQEKLEYFLHVLETYSVDDAKLKRAYARWEETRGHEELTQLFADVEPRRQQLLRRMNHAPGATLALVEMRADLRRIMRKHPELGPVDYDFHHLLTSWFNRGFLRMEEVTWDSSPELHEHILRYEQVHPMKGRSELRRRLQPKDRRIYAFFHPATGNLPLIFVEVALIKGIAEHISPILRSGATTNLTKADTAVLYSINNSLDGLAGVSFGNLLIKQVIDHVAEQLPHLNNYVTLSPIPGFRRWLETEALSRQSKGDPSYSLLVQELQTLGGKLHNDNEQARARLLGDKSKLPASIRKDLRERLLIVLARYIAEARRDDGKPLDPVARFHLGNGATAWQLNWPADPAAQAWEQSYGAMINYRYEPSELERRHEHFARHRTISLGPQVHQILNPRARARNTVNHSMTRGNSTPMTKPFATIHQQFLDRVNAHPDKALFVLPEGRQITYAETLTTVQQIAAKLIDDGVQPGDRVAMQVEKSPEAIALYLASLQIGAVFLPLNTAYTGKEMDYFIEDATPRVLVCSPNLAAEHQHRDVVVETLGAETEGTLLDAEGSHTEVYAAGADDLASILYTSGTTGRSKGAMLTHQNLASNCAALLDAWNYTSEDRLIHALPIFHIHGLFVAANMTLAAGATMHYLTKFDAETIIDLLPEASVLMGVPTFYTRLLKDDRLTPETTSGMRLFVSGSAPLLASDHEAFQQRTGHAILERYGMTETGMNTTNPYSGGPRKPGTVGKPLPGVQLRVTDRETGEEMPDGQVGHVEVAGPNVFAGYWQMPEKTAEEFRRDGFFITGDLGMIDDDGYLRIVGRNKDLVITGGYNVYPKEVEEHLDTHPDVLESAVIGVAHPDLGEAVVAVVVPAAGQDPQPDEVLASFSENIARFKQPKAVEVLPALPRNVMGKVQKAELRNKYADLFTVGT